MLRSRHLKWTFVMEGRTSRLMLLLSAAQKTQSTTTGIQYDAIPESRSPTFGGYFIGL